MDGGERFVLTCHARPDGDAVGSLLGLGLALEAAGRDATLYMEAPVPPHLAFLPGSGRVVTEPPVPLAPGTVLVVLDCGEAGRVGRGGERLAREATSVVVLDHHLTQGEFGRDVVRYVDPEVFATGAIVLWVLNELGWPVSAEIATNLYAAIVSDTGAFQHNNTTALAFAMAEYLVSRGADPSGVARALYQSWPERRLRLLGLVLHTLEVRAGGRIGLLQATPEMFRTTGAREADTEDFVNYCRSIDSVEVAVFIREVHAGNVAVSLRSKTTYDVAALAQEFGGGGHFHAAGFRRSGSAGEIRALLLERLARDFDDLRP
nr:DHH family phosphoesterase [Dissulfurirhabdus thermomarina]